ncbi:MAG: helix-turn-helix domain-containing protein [Sedimenticola sp.]
MDERIADYLQSHSTPDVIRVSSTHQKIASDLGTSREVVSRNISLFEASSATWM